MSELYKTADFKAEKHVPVIDAPSTIKANELMTIKVVVGKEIAHPNKTEHHIRWIKVLFWPNGAKFPIDLGGSEFSAHGESTEGPDKGGVYTEPQAIVALKTDKPGKIIATSYCNIHGLWKSEQDIKIS